VNREEAARRFAELVGWDVVVTPGEGMLYDTCPGDPGDQLLDRSISVPDPDAPLHEHGAFAFRIAEAAGMPNGLAIYAGCANESGARPWCVSFDGPVSYADDLSHAALLAAIATLASKPVPEPGEEVPK
jgi:hypothetical protein